MAEEQQLHGVMQLAFRTEGQFVNAYIQRTGHDPFVRHIGRRSVTSILIGDRAPGGHREWRVVDWVEAGGKWIDHKCPSKPDPEPVRKAA